MKIRPRLILQLLFFVVLLPFLPLLISGHWDWWEAWIYAAVCILGFVVSRLLAARRHPDIISERSRILDHEDTKPFDKTLAPLLGLGGLLIMAVPGLEARLGSLMVFNLPVKILMLLLIVGGYCLGAYALIENASSPAWCASRPSAATRWYPADPTAGCAIQATPGRC